MADNAHIMRKRLRSSISRSIKKLRTSLPSAPSFRRRSSSDKGKQPQYDSPQTDRTNSVSISPTSWRSPSSPYNDNNAPSPIACRCVSIASGSPCRCSAQEWTWTLHATASVRPPGPGEAGPSDWLERGTWTSFEPLRWNDSEEELLRTRASSVDEGEVWWRAYPRRELRVVNDGMVDTASLSSYHTCPVPAEPPRPTVRLVSQRAGSVA